MRPLQVHAIFILLVILISSCATNKSTLFISNYDGILDTLKTVHVINSQGPEDPYYKLKFQDIIAVSNNQNLEFGASSEGVATITTYTIDDDGTANLPVVGKVQLAGLTRKEAQGKLQDIYSKSLLKNPIIDVKIVNLQVILLGEFGQKGKVLLSRDQTTLIDVLGEVGGLSPQADPGKIKIIRGDRRNPEIIYVNLRDINSLGSKKLILQNNDIVYVPKRKVYERTESLQNFSMFIQPALVLFNTALIIYNISR